MTTSLARLRRDADGFTLIELLVVIIIIGILAAIAIPLFLDQRRKGYDAASKSDLRDLAGYEELYLTDRDSYATIAAIQATEPRLKLSSGVTLTVVKFDVDRSYCLSATHVQTGNTFWYDSQAGGMQPRSATGCPLSTAGINGDSQSG